MKYIEMTIEEASEYYKNTPGKTVLVAIQDLERNEVASFKKIEKVDGEKIIKQAETIARVYDDFMNQLRIYTTKQIDIQNIQMRGKLSTILIE